MNARRRWSEIVERLNEHPHRQLRFRMGSPGSAQVTRCRLLAEWSNLEVWTVGSNLYLCLARQAG